MRHVSSTFNRKAYCEFFKRVFLFSIVILNQIYVILVKDLVFIYHFFYYVCGVMPFVTQYVPAPFCILCLIA